MFFLTYASTATQDLSKADLNELLAQCRKNNADLGVTGMLLYKDGNFMQVLEGEESTVRSLYAKIGGDPRHKGEILLQQGTLEERQFPGWSMGYRDLDSHEASSIPEYSEFLNTPLTGEEFSANPSRSQKLLLSFKRNM
ncbi:hypothetical protein GBA65_18810 [Rubrobacter marinus]|uniref:BLUF domain-containing protein n=1 Tax=Rubrobacter marinus TaxID=2653852 RepID=A0A6G8Q182_9ACTN|nr:BLUF domain-containing protein [Rubrobacter marinus]QIN80232.1 hypothetical protein GBA65_18810 [Rubrobacter marinus]